MSLVFSASLSYLDGLAVSLSMDVRTKAEILMGEKREISCFSPSCCPLKGDVYGQALWLDLARFALFPEPLLLWDSLMRSWNLYAPEILQVDKQLLRKLIMEQIVVADYHLQTTTLQFPKYIQKGFIGTCTYHIQVDKIYAPQVAALAEFARYAGIGYKTTMGMGQARLEESMKEKEPKHVREARLSSS